MKRDRPPAHESQLVVVIICAWWGFTASFWTTPPTINLFIHAWRVCVRKANYFFYIIFSCLNLGTVCYQSIACDTCKVPKHRLTQHTIPQAHEHTHKHKTNLIPHNRTQIQKLSSENKHHKHTHVNKTVTQHFNISFSSISHKYNNITQSKITKYKQQQLTKNSTVTFRSLPPPPPPLFLSHTPSSLSLSSQATSPPP